MCCALRALRRKLCGFDVGKHKSMLLALPKFLASSVGQHDEGVPDEGVPEVGCDELGKKIKN